MHLEDIRLYKGTESFACGGQRRRQKAASKYSGASHRPIFETKKKKKNKTMEAVDAADTWIWKNMGQPGK